VRIAALVEEGKAFLRFFFSFADEQKFRVRAVLYRIRDF